MAPSLVRRELFGSRLGRRCEDRCQLHVNFEQRHTLGSLGIQTPERYFLLEYLTVYAQHLSRLEPYCTAGVA
jgi:hypothetical protein